MLSYYDTPHDSVTHMQARERLMHCMHKVIRPSVPQLSYNKL